MKGFVVAEGKPRPREGRVFLSLPRPRADFKGHIIFWPVAAGGVVLDLWTKHAVFALLLRKDENIVSLIDGFLRLVIAGNTGAAFGIASGQHLLLKVVSFIALAAVVLFFLFAKTKNSIFYVALGFFAAGISGNLCDRLFNNGIVRDFIDVYWRQYHWPAFNVADSLLCMGAALVLILSFTERLSQKHGRQQK